MPTFTVNTNVSAAKIPEDLLTKLSDKVASLLGKPKSYVQVHINPGQMLVMGGTNDPAAACSLVSLGGVSGSKNKKTSEALMDILSKALNIDKARMYINFVDVEGQNMGWNGSTF